MNSYFSRVITLFIVINCNTWTDAAPTGPMADYYVSCSWALTRSEAACANLLDKLEATDNKTPAEKLALLKSRKTVTTIAGDELTKEEFCKRVEMIVQEHSDYAEALYSLSHCTSNRKETIGLLQKALEIEPDNYSALSFLLLLAHGILGTDNDDLGIDPEMLSNYREALYKAAKMRSEWGFSMAPSDRGSSRFILQGLLKASHYIYIASERAGDQEATSVLRLRVRQDVGLDDLDYSTEGSCQEKVMACRRGSGEDNLLLACNHNLHKIGLADVCVSAIDKVVGEAAKANEVIPDIVLSQVESTANLSRRLACDKKSHLTDDCFGWEATETNTVARLRTVLKDYGGKWSSEHHRVYSQGFLGDRERLEGLRVALQVDPQNVRARCDLVRALEIRGETEESRIVLGDGDPECLKNLWKGFTLVDREDVLAWQKKTGLEFVEIRNQSSVASSGRVTIVQI